MADEFAYVALANSALADGDAVAAKEACEKAWQHTYPLKEVFTRSLVPMAEAALGCGDLIAARRWADDTVKVASGHHRMVALTARARVAIAQSEPRQAETDLHDAIAIAERTGGYLYLPDAPECLASLAVDSTPEHAARLFGAADNIRQRNGNPRFKAFQAAHDAALTTTRDALG